VLILAKNSKCKTQKPEILSISSLQTFSSLVSTFIFSSFVLFVAAASLSSQFRSLKGPEKKYLALVEGDLSASTRSFSGEGIENEEVVLRGFLRKEHLNPLRANNKLFPSQSADLSYRFLSLHQLPPPSDHCTASLLDVRLGSGRKHQVRAMLAHLGNPVVMDVRYGAQRLPEHEESAAIALHAYSLKITHPDTGKDMLFLAPPPATPLWGRLLGRPDLHAVWERLRGRGSADL
jgi:23S rRNA-/tRNA-specific pseudouridylate synthase